jgi:hypothetical protein
LKVTMEHGHANHLSDDWASTAYWYQTLPSKPFSILPVEERIQLMPQVINPVAPPAPQALNDEMKKSFQEAEERMKKYSEGRKVELQKKLDRTPGHSHGNIEWSKQVRSSFLSGENK